MTPEGGPPGGRHLHLDDYPQTLRLLAALLAHRPDREELGYSPTEHGAWIDWDRLTTGPLSSTETAAIRIAQGCGTLERAGGLPPHLASIVVEVVTTIA
jgi:hypothetical protein